MLRRFLSQALALSWLSLWLSVPDGPGTVVHTEARFRG